MESLKDRIAYDTFIKAKIGNKLEEIKLLKIFNTETRTIRFQYLSRARKLGLSILDLENYVVHALFILLYKEFNHINPNTFISFFKYIYLRVVQQELRTRFRKKELMITDLSNLPEDPFFNLGSSNKVIKELSENHTIIENEICETFLIDNVCKLNHKEKKILSLYTIGFNLFEQSKFIKVPNSTLYNRFRSGLSKIRTFIDKHQVFEYYQFSF